MNTPATALPDVTRPDSKLVVTSELSVHDPARQRLAADAMIDVFERVPWPEGLLSHTVLLGMDGVSLQHYAQWASLEAYESFTRNDPPERLAFIRSVAPDLERVTSGQYALHRSMGWDTGELPGCIVIITVDFDGPDEQRQRDWVDAVFAAFEGNTAEPEGGLAGHFHLSTDGTRVINYAEWVDEAAHIAALEGNDGRSIGGGPLWDRVQNFPGLKARRVRRFRPYRSVSHAFHPAEGEHAAPVDRRAVSTQRHI